MDFAAVAAATATAATEAATAAEGDDTHRFSNGQNKNNEKNNKNNNSGSEMPTNLLTNSNSCCTTSSSATLPLKESTWTKTVITKNNDKNRQNFLECIDLCHENEEEEEINNENDDQTKDDVAQDSLLLSLERKGTSTTTTTKVGTVVTASAKTTICPITIDLCDDDDDDNDNEKDDSTSVRRDGDLPVETTAATTTITATTTSPQHSIRDNNNNNTRRSWSDLGPQRRSRKRARKQHSIPPSMETAAAVDAIEIDLDDDNNKNNINNNHNNNDSTSHNNNNNQKHVAAAAKSPKELEKQERIKATAKYRQMLGPIRMAFVSQFVYPDHAFMKQQPIYFHSHHQHNYTSSWSLSSKQPSSSSTNNNNKQQQQRAARKLHRELIEYQLNLPIELSSSIFCRVLESRTDLIRALITGPEETPYANGCFLFDIALRDYPARPPQVQFLTTGSGRVRFNPNLYACGKVCLSLLGTWSGPGWQPNQSTLLQVLVSIQGLILVPDPYYNEPGFEMQRNSKAGKAASKQYTLNIRRYTLQHAMDVHLCALLLFQQEEEEQQQQQQQNPNENHEDHHPVVEVVDLSSLSSSITTTTVAAPASTTTATPSSSKMTTTRTTTSNNNKLLFAYSEFQQVLLKHFCQRACAIDEQLNQWIKDDKSIQPMAEQVRSHLQQLVQKYPQYASSSSTSS